MSQRASQTDSANLNKGIIIFSLATSDDIANSIGVQPDGKIIVSGYINTSFTIARLLPNGSKDKSFGNEGIVKTALKSGDEHTSALVIQPDGKLVVAGCAYSDSSNNFVIFRYNADGTLDPAFGRSGIRITSLGKNDDNATSMVYLPDGKIVVAGSSNDGNDDSFALVKYNSDGTIDNAFGSRGVVISSVRDGNDRATSVALFKNGKLVAAGYSDSDFALVKYLKNGELDPNFGDKGKVVTSIRNAEAIATGLSIQKNSKMVVGGSSNNGYSYDFVAVRYDSTGKLDPEFGKQGIAYTSFRDGDDKARCMVQQTDGKFLLAGSSDNGFSTDFAVARYNSDGSLDVTFGNKGMKIISVRRGDECISAIALQTDGKIIMAGNSNDSTNNDFAIIRLNPDGSFDTSFGNQP